MLITGTCFVNGNIAGCELGVSGCVFRVSGCVFRVASYEFRVAGSRIGEIVFVLVLVPALEKIGSASVPTVLRIS